MGAMTCGPNKTRAGRLASNGKLDPIAKIRLGVNDPPLHPIRLSPMPPTHLLLALLVVAIWGTNFAIIKIGLETWPPLLFVALRFALSALPLFLLPRPRAPLGSVIAYGLLLGVGQFGVLFYAMQHDISPGLAALVIQMQVFFTIALSALLNREAIGRLQLLGLSLALAGMVVIGCNVGSSGGGAVLTLHGLLLVLFAATCWAAANLVVKRLGTVDVLSLVAWSSAWPAVALALLSLVLEGPREIAAAFRAAGTTAWPGCRVAGGRQHAARLRCVELASRAPSGCDRYADGAARSRVRAWCFGHAIGRTAADLENCRRDACAGGAWHHCPGEYPRHRPPVHLSHQSSSFTTTSAMISA